MKKRLLSLLLALVMLVGMIPMNSLTAYATELTEAEQTASTEAEEIITDKTLPVLLGVNVTLADILDTSDGWMPYPVDKSAVFEPGTGTASVNFSNSVLYTNGSFSTPVATVSAGGKYYFYITVTSLPSYNPVDYSKISVDHINVTMYGYKVDFLYAQDYVEGAHTGMKFCFVATHNPAPKVMFGSVELKDGYYLQSGTPITSVNEPSGGYAYYKNGMLVLNNYNSSSFSDLVLWDLESINIRVYGSNVLSKIEERYTSVNTQKHTDIAFTGDGSLTVSSNTANCVKTTGDVTVNGGNLTLTFGGGNALSGLSAASLTVNDGELVLKGTTSAINSGCTVDAAFIYVDENNTLWDGETDLSTYKYLRLDVYYVYVGGVKMYDGDYLAVGATTTQTTKPSGGYAYYEDGTLTLNNYSYEGKGYHYDGFGNYAIVYAERDLTVELVGTNTLKNTRSYTDAIYTGGGGCLTFEGSGSLNATGDYATINAEGNLTVNGGTIVSTAQDYAMLSRRKDIIINGGNVTASGKVGLRSNNGYVKISGGNVTATGDSYAIAGKIDFKVPKDGVILASTTVDGELGEYVAANHNTYKKIVIRHTPAVYVGGVGMSSGDYLAVGASTIQTTKPSGGYAYYEDGKLTLNNYSYEGKGYQYISIGTYATVYANQDLTVKLVGTNSLVQEDYYSETIRIESEGITFDGTGSLCATAGYAGIYVDGTLTVNGGTIVSTGGFGGMISYNQDIIINDGNVTVSGSETYGLRAEKGVVEINGGTVTVTGIEQAIKYSTGFTVAEGMKIQASTTVDGELGEYVAANRDSYKKIVITPPDIYVGGKGMSDGDYLAVGATATQTTKPSGGYAYYKDGKLTLNNYSYEGEGYKYDSEGGYCATVYAEQDLTLELVGTNTLKQTASYSDGIYVGVEASKEKLTIQGDGSLNVTSTYVGILAWGSITVNGGTIISTATTYGMYSDNQGIIINDGNVTVSGSEMYGLRAAYGVVEINGGYVTAIGVYKAISCGFSGSFSVAEGMKIQASTTADGELGEYVAANHDTYKKIVIKPDASNITVNCIGDIDYTVSGNVVTVDHEVACKVGYLDGTAYKAITAVANGDGTYSFTAPAGVTQVLLVVKGDVNGDGKVSSSDYGRLNAYVLEKTTLSAESMFAADATGDDKVNSSDYGRMNAVILEKTTLAW